MLFFFLQYASKIKLQSAMHPFKHQLLHYTSLSLPNYKIPKASRWITKVFMVIIGTGGNQTPFPSTASISIRNKQVQ